MRGWTIGPMLTLALGGFASNAQADEASGAPPSDGDNSEFAARGAGAVNNANRPSTHLFFQAPRAQYYDVDGLIDAASLAHAQSASGIRYRRAAAMAYAPPLSASQDTCMGSHSIGFHGIGFGFSFGTTHSDRTCRRLKNARALENLGYPEAAIQLLCMDREVRRAMDRAGTPCNGRVRTEALPAAEQLPATPEPPLASYAVLFDFDRSRLRPEAPQMLQPLLDRLLADPNLKVEIEGHADWIGSDAYNLRLSRRRAQAVVNWLVAHGIARDRLRAVGKGESEPIADNHTAIGRAQNRRVEAHRWVD